MKWFHFKTDKFLFIIWLFTQAFTLTLTCKFSFAFTWGAIDNQLVQFAVYWSALRWLKTAAAFPCQYVVEDHEQDYLWRRLQNSQLQAERQKKNIIQLSLLFHARAESIQSDPWRLSLGKVCLKRKPNKISELIGMAPRPQ